MSSTSVQDSQVSIEQARCTSTLTILVSIYALLSLITGIFRMNIQEISGSSLNGKICFVTISIVAALLVIALWILVRREGRGKKQGMENNSIVLEVGVKVPRICRTC